MKFYNVIIKYRLQITAALVILGAVTNYYAGFWPAFPLYFVALLLLFGYFFFGPLRLIQEHMESGDMDAAEKVLNSIKFPGLLYKPIRSVYYTLKGNIAMMKQDFTSAEKNMKKGLDLGMPMKEAEGASLLQMGMLCMQKNDIRQAESYIRQAIPQRAPGQGKPGGSIPAIMFNHDDKEGIQSGEGFLSKGEGTKTDNSADRQPNKRNRAIYFEDSGVSRS